MKNWKNMDNQKGSILTLVLLVVILGSGIYLYLGKSNSSNLANQTKQIFSEEEEAPQVTTQAEVAIFENKFIPSTITVSKGQQVSWTNQDKTEHAIASKDLELDAEVLKTDDSLVYVFDKKGIFTVYDDKNPQKIRGIVIVK